MNGALILDKPAGRTSHDVVQAARCLLGERRIGHLGTLDPFATGVLVLLVGSATRLARFYAQRTKTYRGVIRFGYSTDSRDHTGIPLSEDCHPQLNEQEVQESFAAFVGPYAQHPPAYSAKKISGVPAYRLVRRGIAVELGPVPAFIHSLTLLWVEGSRAGFEAVVSAGTYIRSLAHDLGARLGVGGHLEQLRRVAAGEFQDQAALTLETLEERLRQGRPVLIPPEELLPEFPAIRLNEAETARVVHGGDLPLGIRADFARLLEPHGGLLAIAKRVADGLYHPVVVLVSESGGTCHKAANPLPTAAAPAEETRSN